MSIRRRNYDLLLKKRDWKNYSLNRYLQMDLKYHMKDFGSSARYMNRDNIMILISYTGCTDFGEISHLNVSFKKLKI